MDYQEDKKEKLMVKHLEFFYALSSAKDLGFSKLQTK